MGQGESARCLCESTVSESRAKAEIEKHEGYHLVEFRGTNAPVPIKSDKCGHTFSCRYHKFLGAWLETQRKALASGSMSDERLSTLKTVDHDFPAIQDTLEIEWNRMFALYCRYVEAGNPAYVTRSVMFEGEKLGQWYYVQMRLARAGMVVEERMAKFKGLYPNFPEKK